MFHVIKLEDAKYFSENPIHFAASKQVTLEEDGYVSFNVTSVLGQWLESKQERKGKFYLEVYPEHFTSPNTVQSPAAEIVYTDTEGRYSRTTQLVLRAYSKETRGKRYSGIPLRDICSQENSTKNCCKRNLMINIHRDLNWTWIIEPKEFSANFCSGFCPTHWPTAAHHTNLLLTANTVNPTGSPAPCCVPDIFVPITLLTFFNQTITGMFTIDDISIGSCICR